MLYNSKDDIFTFKWKDVAIGLPEDTCFILTVSKGFKVYRSVSLP